MIQAPELTAREKFSLPHPGSPGGTGGGVDSKGGQETKHNGALLMGWGHQRGHASEERNASHMAISAIG